MKHSTKGPRRLAGLVAAAAILTILAGAGVAGHATRTAVARPFGIDHILAKARTNPLPTSQCLAQIGIHCYTPAQFENAYELADLHTAGINGAGETIAIVDSFGSPTIANDLHQFDQTFGVSNTFGIPVDPAIAQDPSLTVIQPAGAVPSFDPTNDDMVGWAEETTLDVEWAHVFAPKANILLVETPVSETEGVQGFPEIVQAENYVIDNHLANVISQSFGATENTFPSRTALTDLRSAFKNARLHGVTVLGASGDDGSTDAQLNGEDLYTTQVNSWPSADPLVTSVGGTQLNLDDSGNRLSPDVVWNDGYGAPGGGPSHVFDRPDFQDGVQSVVGTSRGTPDISLNAAVDGGVWVYYTFVTPTSPWHIFGGTSAATPEFSGVVAMADQVAGKSLGDLNDALYSIPYGGGLVDVTQGNNDIGPFENSDGNTYHVPGFSAGTGYDMASGVGTLDASRFVPALVSAANVGDALSSCSGAHSFISVRGNVRVKKGTTCTLTDSAIRGTVTVDDGGTLIGHGLTINGDLHGSSGAQLGPDDAGQPSIVTGTSS